MNSFSKHYAAILFAALPSMLCMTSVRASVRISPKPTQNMSCASGVCAPTARNAVLNATDLAGMLSSGDVDGRRWTNGQGHRCGGIAELGFEQSPDALVLPWHDHLLQGCRCRRPGAMTLITKYDRLGGYLYFTRKGRVDFRNTTSSLIINGNSYGLITSIHDLKVAGGNVPYLAFAKNIKAAKAYSDVPVETFQDTLEGLGHSISHLTISSTQTEQPLGLVARKMGQSATCTSST